MALQKVIKVNTGGELEEVTGVDTTVGVADAGKLVHLDSAGLIALEMMPVGIGPDTVVVTALENLSAGDFVEITASGVRKADATNGRPANGFVLSAFLSAASALVYKDSKNTALVGLTVGAKYYLGAAGNVTTSVNTNAGELLQFLGYATSATVLDVEIARPITRA